MVTWVTFYPTRNSIVWYGTLLEGLTNQAKGLSQKFIDGGQRGTIRYIHRVVLSHLIPQTLYGKYKLNFF